MNTRHRLRHKTGLSRIAALTENSAVLSHGGEWKEGFRKESAYQAKGWRDIEIMWFGHFSVK